MAIIDSRKVDYLWKKLGYGRSKTDVNSIKNATNESIASPLFLRGDLVWAQSDVIPSVIPSSSLEAVQVYPTTAPVECVGDITASPNRTWKTNSIDWIPPELGDTYQVKVYVHTSGDAANAASNGTQLFAAGSGNNDEWFFDYQSGLVHFIGTNLPNGINFTGKSIYVSGARYTGVKGVPAPGAAITFSTVGVGSHFSVTGFSTFTNTVDINNGAYIDNIQIGITGDNEIDTTTGNLIIDSFEGTVTVDDRLIVVGLSTFNSDVDFDSNVNIDSTLIVTGVSTFTGNIDANGDLDVDGYTELDTVNVSEKLNVVGVSTFGSDLDINASVDISNELTVDGTSDLDELNVAGLSTFLSNVDIDADLDVDGYTELDAVNISETLNVVGISTFSSDLDINASIDIAGHAEIDSLNVSGLSTFESDVRIKTGDRLYFGDTDNFSVLFGGAETYLTQHTSYPLSILGNTAVNIRVNGSENAIVATANGSVELYWDNNKRLETTGSGIDITGHTETDTLNVSGLSTFASNVDINASVDISGNLDLHGELFVDGTSDLDELNVAGLSTFLSNVDIDADLDVDGRTELDTTNISETLNVVGVTTLGSNVDINASVDISGSLDIHTDLDVDGHTELDNVNISENVLVAGVVTATSFHTGAEGSAIRVNSSTITGPSTITIDPSGIGDNTGLVIIAGDLQVDGTQTIINSTSVTVDDLNIMLADGAANDAAADGGGFTVQSGDGNKTFQFEATGDNFGSSEHINLATGKTLKIANTEVLRSDLLTVANAALSGVTTIGTTLDVNGDLDVDGYTELDSTNISETLNVVGLTTLGSNVDINADLDVDGYTELDSTNISETLNVVGLTTLGSNVDINADLDVDGYTELDSTNISETLNVVGLTTLGSNVDINASVDISNELTVDGTSDLDELNVAGLSTFASNVDINASVDISGDLTTHGELVVDGTSDLDELNVAGLSTFASNVDINSSVDISGNLDLHGELFVDGTSDLDELNVAGLSTFASNVDINASVDISTNLDVGGTLNVTGVTGFSSHISIPDHAQIQIGNQANGDLQIYHDGTNSYIDNNTGKLYIRNNVDDVDGGDIYIQTKAGTNAITLFDNGTISFYFSGSPRFAVTSQGTNTTGNSETDELEVTEIARITELNVTGLSTFASNVDINASVDISNELTVDGTSDLDELNVAGLSTFLSNVDINASVDISNELTVDGTSDLDELNVAGLSTFISDVNISSDLIVDGTSDLDELNVVGLSTFASNVDINASVDISNELTVDGTTDLDEVNVAGLSTFLSNVDINASVDISNELTVDGTSDLDELNVAGLSTFASNVDINSSVDVSGGLNIVGLTTLGSNVDISGELVVDGTSDLDHLNVTGIATISDRLDVNGDLHDIAGTIALDNVDVSGIVSATRFDGDLNALGKTYYVATTGSDSNSGNNINEPYLTIEHALSVATNGDIINISAGVYEETCPLTVPRGVTLKGAGLRATTIRPTTATQQENIFLLNDISTVEDFTIRGSYFDSTADTGYAFSYATGIAITTRSPYVQRVTVLNTGSVITTDDPYGYDTADSPPTSYIAGAGAKIDGSLVAGNSLEAGMLFNEVTFFTPNNKGIVLTNGARAEYLNCFHYFASQAIVGLAGTVGIAGTADARLKFSNPNVTPSVNDVVKLFDGGVGIATGTITTYDNDYATIDGLGEGAFTSVGTGTTQDVRFYQSDGTTQTGIASAILLADYTMFGAEMRSVGCAVEYGSQGVVADGNGVKLRMFATNFNHVGSGKDFTNDATLTVQANEVIETNSGQVSYVSIDQAGDFRVGDALYINQETGNVSFAATSYSLDVTGQIDVTDGTNTSTLAPTSLTVGGLQLAANTLSSTSGNIIIDPAGANKTLVQGDLGVVGILTAQVLTADALQKNDTSIAIDDTGSNGTIRLNTDNVEALRVTNDQKIGIGITNPSAKLHVVGTSLITGITTFNSDVDIDANLNVDSTLIVTGLSTFTGAIDANGGLDVSGTTDLDHVNVSGILTVTGAIDANGGLDVAGTTGLDNVVASGIVTATEFHTGAEGSAIRVSSDTISGPAILNIDPSGIGDNTGTVVIKGDLQVDGTQTIINSTTVTVNDLNIQVADGAANDAAADGAGITVNSGDGNKTFQFEATGDNFGSSEHINLATGKTYKINNTEVLSSTRLTVSEIVASGIGTITTIDATNATIDNLTFTSGTAITSVDTDLASVSASDDTLASAKAIKTYVDAQVTAQDLDIAGDTGTGAVDLDSQSLTIAGTANEIETSVSGQTITVGLPDDITVSTSLTVGSATTINDSGIIAGIITATSVNGTVYATGSGEALHGTHVGPISWNAADPSGDFILTPGDGSTVSAAFTGNVTGNVTGDVLDASANVIVDISTGDVNANRVFAVGIGGASTGEVHTSYLVTTAISYDGANPSDSSTWILTPGDGLVGAAFTGNVTGDVTGNVTATSGNSSFNNVNVSGITTSPIYDTDHTRISTIIHASSGTNQLTAHVLSATSYRSVEYLIQATEGANVHLTKLLVIHDGTTAYMTEYGSVFNTSVLASYDTVINSGNIELLVTPSSALPTEYKISYTTITI